MVLKGLFYSFLSLLVFSTSAQWDNKRDSLLNLAEGLKNKDSSFFLAMDDLLWESVFNTPEDVERIYQAQIKLTQRLKWPEYEAKANYSLSIHYDKTNQTVKALQAIEKCHLIYAELNDSIGLASATGQRGLLFLDIGQMDKAEEYLKISYNIFLEKGRDYHAAIAIQNLGLIYSDRDMHDRARECFEEYALAAEKMQDTSGLSRAFTNIASTYMDQNKDSLALIYLYKSKALKEAIEDNYGLPSVLGNIGIIESSFGKHNKAVSYCLEGYEKSVKNLTSFAAKLGNCKCLAEAYSQLGKYKEAYQYRTLQEKYKDSMNNSDLTAELTQRDVSFSYKQEIYKDSIQHEKNIEVEKLKTQKKQAELENRNLILIFFIIGFILICLLAAFIFNRLRLIRKQKKIIEIQKAEVQEKNTEIIDSITYAKRIQSAILPPISSVHKNLPKSFILYKPKDIVAGDFYWMEEKNGKILFAAADCTGHGVPGAMVSVICNNGLNRSVREHGLSDPGEILNKTREIVISEFEKSEEEVKDGMDVALCSLDGNRLAYAGANNPLWIIRKGSEEVEEIKADKQPIGKTEEFKHFTTHEVLLNEGDSIYIFSDGFADQFGGDKGKKMKSKNFKKLLLSVQNEPMSAQKSMIDEAFKKWKGEHEQLDDVCVIGVRI